MLAIYLLKFLLVEIWSYAISDSFLKNNIFDYTLRFIESFLVLIPTIFIFLIDIILSPIEILAIIIYLIIKRKEKLKNENKTRL